MKWLELAAHIIDIAFCVSVIVWIVKSKKQKGGAENENRRNR